MDAEAVARVLKSVPLFSALTDAERTELIAHAPRSATVTALDETQVVTLAREYFLRVLERSPRGTREILRLLARTMRRASGRIEDLLFLDVSGRVRSASSTSRRLRPARTST